MPFIHNSSSKSKRNDIKQKQGLVSCVHKIISYQYCEKEQSERLTKHDADIKSPCSRERGHRRGHYEQRGQYMEDMTD